MKTLEIINAVLAVLGALSLICAAIGAVLPEGKAKTFFQLAGSRLLAASASLKGDDKPAAPKVPPLPLILVLLVPLVGCAWLSKPSHYADAARILSCISAEAAAGKSAGEIALTCGLENADAVIDLVTKSQGVASAAPKMAKPAAAGSK